MWKNYSIIFEAYTVLFQCCRISSQHQLRCSTSKCIQTLTEDSSKINIYSEDICNCFIPVTGKYSWLMDSSLAIPISVFRTTGSTHGLPASVRYAVDINKQQLKTRFLDFYICILIYPHTMKTNKS